MKKTLLFTLLLSCSVFVAAQTTTIPDPNFEQALIDLGLDSGSINGSVPTNNIDTVTSLDVSNKSITDLTGIEDFAALQILDCGNNALTALDVTQNGALTELRCAFTNITGLDLSQNTSLNILECNNSKLLSLDVSLNTSLSQLKCGFNDIATLTLGANTALNVLSCHHNNLNSLDISQTTSLITLSCSSNNLSSLDVSVHPILINLFIDGNNLNTLDVSQNLILNHLSCSSNNLSTLDVTKNTHLTNLNCLGNNLSSLDLSKNTDLITLNCSNNVFTSLDFTLNTSLTNLNCSVNNSLTSLDVSQNTLIAHLDCNNTNLGALDLSSNTSLTSIICFDAGLTDLNMKNGNNMNVFTFLAIDNPSLSCITVDDVAYSTTNWTGFVDPGTVFSLDCSLLGVEDKELLGSNILIYPNPNDNEFKLKGLNALVDVKIYDVQGRMLQQVLNYSGENLRTHSLTSGVYLIKISAVANKSQSLTKRMVIR